jgi:CRP-like cAMP-binding protein
MWRQRQSARTGCGAAARRRRPIPTRLASAYPRGVARDEKLDLLGSIPLFSGFDKHRLQRLGMLADEVDLPAGKVLMRQGESGADMMVIVSGSVAVERDGALLNTLGPGDFFGEIALLASGPRTATVTTQEPSRLLVITHREFHSMMDEFPELAAQVMNALAHRIRRLEPDAPH